MRGLRGLRFKWGGVLNGIEDFVAFDEAEGEAGGDEVDAGLDPERQVFATHVGQRGSHRGDFDESLHTGGRGEDLGEAIPEPRHIALRPHHARSKEEDEAEEGEAE